MIVSDVGQAKVFGINIIFGMLCLLLFDIFSVISGKSKDNGKLILIFDVLYFICACVLLWYAQVKYNLGALRYYQLFGLCLGIVIYKICFSKIAIYLLTFVLKGIEAIAVFAAKVILIPVMFVLKWFFTAVEWCENNILHISRKIEKRVKKMKKKRKSKKKTAKKRVRMI